MFCERNYQRSGFIAFKKATIEELLVSLSDGRPCKGKTKQPFLLVFSDKKWFV